MNPHQIPVKVTVETMAPCPQWSNLPNPSTLARLEATSETAYRVEAKVDTLAMLAISNQATMKLILQLLQRS